MRKILLLLATATIASANPLAAIAAKSDSAPSQRIAAAAVEPAPARSAAGEPSKPGKPSEPGPALGHDPIPWAGLDLKWVSRPGSALRTGPSDIIG